MSKPRLSLIREQYEAGHFIRVVNYHSTPDSGRVALDREIARYAEQYDSVTLDDLDRYFDTGTWHKERPGFLPVFYEGYRNSVEVAAPILDTYGLTGWFPIATAFVDCPPEHQHAFALAHDIYLVDEEADRDRIAMSWEEVATLSKRHVVTAHTAHHVGQESVSDPEDLYREVVGSKLAIEAVTGRPTPAFAWLHGTSFGTSRAHDAVVRAAGYRYQFSNTLLQRLA